MPEGKIAYTMAWMPGWLKTIAQRLGPWGTIAWLGGLLVALFLAIWGLVRATVDGIKQAQLDAWLNNHAHIIGNAACSIHEGKGQTYVECLAAEMGSLIDDWLGHYNECHGGSHPGAYDYDDSARKGASRVRFDFDPDDRDNRHWVCKQTITTYKKNTRNQPRGVENRTTIYLEPVWDASPWLR